MRNKNYYINTKALGMVKLEKKGSFRKQFSLEKVYWIVSLIRGQDVQTQNLDGTQLWIKQIKLKTIFSLDWTTSPV